MPAEVEPGDVITNSIGMKLALIPAGEFLMGSLGAERSLGLSGNEHSQVELQHRVRITRPFYVGVYEVTQAEYQSVMGMNPSDFSATGTSKDMIKGLDTGRFPVENVSWHDTQEFCRRLSQKEGRHY